MVKAELSEIQYILFQMVPRMVNGISSWADRKVVFRSFFSFTLIESMIIFLLKGWIVSLPY